MISLNLNEVINVYLNLLFLPLITLPISTKRNKNWFPLLIKIFSYSPSSSVSDDNDGPGTQFQQEGKSFFMTALTFSKNNILNTF